MDESIYETDPIPAQLLFVNDGYIWVIEGHGGEFDDNIEALFGKGDNGKRMVAVPITALFDFFAAMRIAPSMEYAQFLKDNAE